MSAKFFIHYCSGTGGMFLTSVFAKVMNISIQTKISPVGDCHDFGHGIWKTNEDVALDHVYDKQTGMLKLQHVPNKTLYLGHVISNQFIEQHPDIHVIQISAAPEDYFSIAFLAAKKEWPQHWTLQEYNKWVGPDYPPYSPDNIANSDLICKDLVDILLKKQTTDWYKTHEDIKYAHQIDFRTVMGIGTENLAQQVATITGGTVTPDVESFVNEYQQLNQKLYLNK